MALTSSHDHSHSHDHSYSNQSSLITTSSTSGTSGITLNVKDDRYRVSKEYPPNKSMWWRGPIFGTLDNDNWILGNNTIRCECNSMIDAIQTILKRSSDVPIVESWCIKYLQDVFDIFEANMKLMHRLKDELLLPFYKRRFDLTPTVYQKITEYHIQIEEHLKLLCFKLDGIKSVSTSTSTSRRTTEGIEMLKQFLDTFQKDFQMNLLEPSFKYEEDIVVPFVRTYYAPKEISTIYHRVVAKSTKTLIGSFIYHIKRSPVATAADVNDNALATKIQPKFSSKPSANGEKHVCKKTLFHFFCEHLHLE